MRPGSHLRVYDSACDPVLPRGLRAQETVWGQALCNAIWGDLDPEWTAWRRRRGTLYTFAMPINRHEPQRPALTCRLHGRGNSRASRADDLGGPPNAPLRWTAKSIPTLARSLRAIAPPTGGRALDGRGVQLAGQPEDTEGQQLANRTGLTITTCHFPPGISKWNTIEHRMLSYISRNWRGQPLVSLAVIVNLIGATLTATGLRVRCELDGGTYPKGRTISDAQPASLRLTPHRFHGHWKSTPTLKLTSASFAHSLHLPRPALAGLPWTR